MKPGLKLLDSVPAPGSGPAGLTWDGETIWNSDYRDGRIYALDGTSLESRRSLYCPGNLGGLAWDGRYLWQSLYDQEVIRAVDPASNDFDLAIDLTGNGWLSGVAWDGRNLWTVAQQQGQLLMLEMPAGSIRQRHQAVIAAGDIDFHDGYIWASVAMPMKFEQHLGRFEWLDDRREFAVVRVEPSDGSIAANYPGQHLYSGLCWVGDVLWLAHSGSRRLYRMVLD